MFWKHKDPDQKSTKLSGPREIPELVKKNLISTNNVDADTIPFLKAVIKSRETGDKIFDIRIFDPADAEARGIKIADYNTLSANREMIISEGSYDEAAKKADLNVLRSIPKTRLLTSAEILAQIEGLTEPGSSIFFFMAAGSGVGGPLGRGASVIKFNASNGNKKQKKYSVFGASVVNIQPVEPQEKIFESNKPNEIADWLADAQKPRFT